MGFASKWYTSTQLAKTYITKISIVTSYVPTGNGIESWDGSADADGSVMCYRNGTELTVVVPSLPTALQTDMFFKFRSVEIITGLSAVTAIGDFAFAHTPNLREVDLVGSNIQTIGDRACYLSSIEDCVDLSGVPSVGRAATRHKRWGEQGLKELQAIAFPKSIYLNIPYPDNQKNYDDVPFCKYPDGTERSAADSGCASFIAYHIWNYLHKDAPYANWLDWFNATLNADGSFAETTIFDGSGAYYNKLFSSLGWKHIAEESFTTADKANLILDSLSRGYPVWVGVLQNNVGNPRSHAVTVVGCDAETHKVAVLDPVWREGETPEVRWFAFEDIFIGGEDTSVEGSNTDDIQIIDFGPTIAPNTTWYTQGGTSIAKNTITEIEIVDRYVGSGASASWDASEAKDGSIMAYVEGTKLTIAGNGGGRVYANADSEGVFRDFKGITKFKGADIFATDNATTLRSAFFDCAALESLDLNSWNTGKVTSLRGTFNGMFALKSLSVSNWNTNAVDSLRATFQCDVSLEELDLSGWTTPNVTDMTNAFGGVANTGGALKLKRIIGIENWDVSKVTEARTTFVLCHDLAELDLSKWKIRPTIIRGMFQNCHSIEELNLAGFDMSACTEPFGMFVDMPKLKKVTLGEKFSFSGIGSGTGYGIAAVLPTPDPNYIPGADGKWYMADGTGYVPADVPNAKATTYVADKTIWEQPFIVTYGTLQQLGDATRVATGTNKLYTLQEMAASLRS